MKSRPLKTLLLLSLAALAGYGVYAFLLHRSESDPCPRLAELCGMERKGGAPDTCQRMVAALKQANVEESERMAACISEARSCSEATGCTVGAALKTGADVAKGFLGGLQKAMQ
jgi:hypothetical protein